MDIKKAGIIGLAVLGIASLGVAGIVHYLSPSVQSNMSVGSPLNLNITDLTQGTTNGTVAEFGDVVAGSTMDATVDVINLANNPIVNSTIEIACTNEAGDMTQDTAAFAYDDISLDTAILLNGTLYAYTPVADYPSGNSTHKVSITPNQAYVGDLTCGMMAIPKADKKA